MSKKSPNDYPQIKFRPGVNTSLMHELEKRSSEPTNRAYTETARRDLTDYYDLLALCLPRFSDDEWQVLFQALNGWAPEPKAAHTLWAEVATYLSSVDLPNDAFLTRLRTLTRFECWAIANAIRYGTQPWPDQ